MNQIDISIIILNYNTSGQVIRLLNSIVKYLDLNRLEVIVADNNSKDKSKLEQIKEFDFVNFLSFNMNSGFATGNNDAANKAKGKYLLFLNHDIELLDNSIEKLPQIFSNEINPGILSGLLVNYDYSLQYCFNDFPGLLWEFFLMVGNGYKRKIKRQLQKKEISEGKNFDVDWFHGAFIFIDNKLFEEIGGFNEKHFMYGEDVELCYKVKKDYKKRNICIPNIRLYHETKSSVKDNKNDDLYNFHINRGKLLIFENYNRIYNYLLKLILIIGTIIRVIALPFWKKFRGFKRQKLMQLLKILEIIFSKKKLINSKYEYVSR